MAGNKFQDVHVYYELVKVALVGNAHGVQLVMSVPLKTAAQLFTIFKILVFPFAVVSRHLKISVRLPLLRAGGWSTWLHALYGGRFAAVYHKQRHYLPCKSPVIPITGTNVWREVYSSSTQIVTNCAVRTCCDTTRIRLFYITGRSGRTTFRIHVALRIMGGPHSSCYSGKADSYTTQTPATSPPRS